MRFKLDENLGRRAAEVLRHADHDVSTVPAQALSGCDDEALFRTCAQEGRILVTLDHDFGQVIRFPPTQSAGIVILEVPHRASIGAMLQLLRELLALAAIRPIRNELWIVEPGRVRIHQSADGS